MTCDDARELLHPYTDGELDLVRHVEVERHLAGCPACAERERELRALREVLASALPYHRAPNALRDRVRRALPAPPRPSRRFSGRLIARAAGVLLVTALAATGGVLIGRGRDASEARVAEAVVAGHVRSLQAGHATDVESTDRHTVKPWFQGKLEFAPPVPDLTAAGYPLVGGRLDYLTDRPVAALVYGRRLHTINVFLWPTTEPDAPAHAVARQGFHMRSWRRSGLECWVISDLSDEGLDDFVAHFRERASAP